MELGLNKIDVARAAGITITTYGNIEAGRSVRDTTYGKVEPALGWATGTCLDVLHGEAPTIAEVPPSGGGVISPVTDEDFPEAMGQIVQDAAIATTDLPAPEIRKLKQRVLEMLQQHGKLPPTDRN